jgi:hypothetical protein
MTQLFNFPTLCTSLAIGAMTLAAAPAQAVVYDFTKTGGPGSGGTGDQIFVEVTENLSTAANDVLFKFTHDLPVYSSDKLPSLGRLYFDTGSYTSLFSGSLSIIETYGFVDLPPSTPVTHPFFQSVDPFTPEYKFGNFEPPLNGINPGEYAVVSATLGGSNSFADVISAMNVGINSNLATAVTGLRIGVFTWFLNGTGGDDAAFVTNSIVAVPEAETWAMMLAGLGLVGFMARRRMA